MVLVILDTVLLMRLTLIDKNRKKRYEGLGFVEALIALMVSGIVGVILMQISVSTLQKLRQLDVQDAIAIHASSSAVILQKIAIQDMGKSENQKDFYNLVEGLCYGINTDDAGINSQQVGNRDTYKDVYLVEEDSEFFRIFCVQKKYANKVIVKIVVGSNKLNGLATTDSDVKDYSYVAVINI